MPDAQSAGDPSAGVPSAINTSAINTSAVNVSANNAVDEARGDLVIDIGGTKVIVALTWAGEVRARARLASGGLSSDGLARDVVAAARSLAEREGVNLRAAVVAVPGTIDRRAGVVVNAANLPFCGFPLGPSLSQGLGGIDVVLEDDANCGALGEASAGPETACNLVYITLSTGIGMGTLVNGRLLVGAHGYAGELGHVTVVPGGRVCGCGRRGCLEAYASGTAIASLGSEVLGAPSSSEAVIAAAEHGDEGCLRVVDDAVAKIENAVRMLQLVVDPEVVVLGGGLMTSPYFNRRVIGAFPGEDKQGGWGPVVRASVFGSDSVIVGGMRILEGAHMDEERRAV